MLKRYLVIGLILAVSLVGMVAGCAKVIEEPTTGRGKAALGGSRVSGGATVQTSGVRSAGVGALAVSSVTGKVTDCYTGNAISGANVYTDTSIATTDASGNYTLTNVAAGNVTITAVADGYNAISVVSSASTINFGLIKRYYDSSQATYPTGTITGEVLDANGNRMTFGSTQEGGKTIYKYASVNASSSTYYTYGYGSVGDNGTFSFTAPAGELFLSLNIYKSIYDSATEKYSWSSENGTYTTTTLQQGETKKVNLQLPAAYGTISGKVTAPSGYTYTFENCTVSVAILEKNMGASVGYRYLDSDGSYSVQVPPTQNVSYVLGVGAWTGLTGSSYLVAGSYTFDYNITIAGGEQQTRNYTFLTPPAISSPAHNATNVSVSGATLSWTKPSDWDPDFYGLAIYESYGSTTSFSLLALVPKDVTSFQIPARLQLTPERQYVWGVGAFKSAGADINSFDFRNFSLEDISLVAGSFTTAKASGVLARIAVTPEAVTLATSEVRQFYATGYDSYNSPVSISPTWKVSSYPSGWGTYNLPGSIDANGLFTATSEAYYYWKKTGYVIAQSGYVTGYTIVTVEAQ